MNNDKQDGRITIATISPTIITENKN